MKTPALESFLIKLRAFRPLRLQQKCFRVKFSKFFITSFFKNTSGGCFWELVYMVTQSFSREVQFYEVVGIIHGGGYFRGFMAFEKLRY